MANAAATDNERIFFILVFNYKSFTVKNLLIELDVG
jgi:hypothetical protein